MRILLLLWPILIIWRLKMDYESGLWPAKTIDLYVNGGKISCRMKGKYEITKVLEGDDNNDINHQLFIRVANLLISILFLI